MRERVHHPAGVRELLQVLQDSARRARVVQAPPQDAWSPTATSSRFAGTASACPRRWTSTSAGCRRIPAGYGFVTPERPLEVGGGDIYISGPHLERGDARRPRRRPHRADQGRRAGRGPRHPHPRAQRRMDRRPLRSRRARHGLRRAVRSPRPDGHRRAAGPGGRGVARRDGDAWSSRGGRRRRAARIGPRRRGARRHRRPRASTPRSSSASTGIPDAHPAEAVDEASRLGAAVVAERDIKGRTRLPSRASPSRSTASTRATSTTRSRSSS